MLEIIPYPLGTRSTIFFLILVTDLIKCIYRWTCIELVLCTTVVRVGVFDVFLPTRKHKTILF